MIPPTDAVLNKISQEFTYAELLEATNSFSSSARLGEGTYGTVFRGCLRDGTEVAIKYLASPKEGGFREEVEVLSRFRHPNLVILMGFARNGPQRYLVYELLPGGDLHSRLNKDPGFGWRQRLSVVLDAALGLSHLHGSRPQVFHRDVKTQNILMDRNGTGKVADFGLACLALPNQRSLVVTHASGTLGYADPLYIQTGVVTEKSEVYSLGMVLLEVLTGRPPALQHPGGRIEYQFEHIGGDLGRLLLLVDPRAQWPRSMSERVGFLGLQCTCKMEHQRPSFVQIVAQLRSWLRDEPVHPGFPAVAGKDWHAQHDPRGGAPRAGQITVSPMQPSEQASARMPAPDGSDRRDAFRQLAGSPSEIAGISVGSSGSTNPFAMPAGWGGAVAPVQPEWRDRHAPYAAATPPAPNPWPAPQQPTVQPLLMAEPSRHGRGAVPQRHLPTEPPAPQEEPPGSAPPGSAPPGREEDIQQLLEMGYTRERAEAAFRRNSTLQGAVHWLLQEENASG